MNKLLGELLVKVREIAAETSHLIMEIYVREDIQLSIKSDNSPLTQADMTAHHYIVEQLQKLTPDIPVLSEENADEIDSAVRLGWSRYWLIDPLDGTKEFIAQNGEFCVNIALIDNHQPVLGVVAVPAKKLSYFAAQGLGAFKAGPDEEAISIQCRDFGSSEKGVELFISRREHNTPIQNCLDALPAHRATELGSAIKICMVAEGKADLYPQFGKTSEWDTAATQCIINEAGGTIMTLTNNQTLTYGQKQDLTNPPFVAVSKTQTEISKEFLHQLGNH